MPKSDSAQTLLKRLEKIERAQGRLGDITTRIRAQAETLAELLKVAQAFAAQSARAKATAAKRTARAPKKAAQAPAAARTAAATPARRPRRTPPA